MKKSRRLPNPSWLGVIGLLAVLSGCATNTSIRQHPDFFGATRTIRSVAVLPPQVTHVHITFTGENERDFALEKQIAGQIANSARTNLERKGYAVDSELQVRLEGDDKEFNFQYEQFKTAYAQASNDLYSGRAVPVADSSKFRVGLGPIASQLSQATNSDALIFVGYKGFSKSGGQQAKDMVASVLLGVLTGVVIVQAARGGGLEVALVDGASGDVLWSNRSGAPNADPAVLLGVALRPLPEVPPSLATPTATGGNAAAMATPTATSPGSDSIQVPTTPMKPAE